MAMNALLGGSKNSGHGGSGSGSSNPLGGLASQFLGGGNHSSGNGNGSGGNNVAGKLVGQLASSFLSTGNKPQQPQNYHGSSSSGQQQSQNQGGLSGVLGGVSSFLGGSSKPSNQGGVSRRRGILVPWYDEEKLTVSTGTELRVFKLGLWWELHWFGTYLQPAFYVAVFPTSSWGPTPAGTTARSLSWW